VVTDDAAPSDGARIVRHGRSVTLQMPEVKVLRGLLSSKSCPLSRRYDHRRRRDAENLDNDRRIGSLGRSCARRTGSEPRPFPAAGIIRLERSRQFID